MHHWQEKQRQRLHHNMIEQAKPTIKRYSRSREQSNQSHSRSKHNPPSSLNSINMPFQQVLAIFKLKQYQSLLAYYGFPAKIKDKDSSSCIDQMMMQVQEKDQEQFLSLMSALLAISTEDRSVIKRTPVLKRSVKRQYPPAHNSTNLKKSESIGTKKSQKTTTFRIKSKTQLHRPSMMETPSSKLTEKSTIPKRSKAAKDDTMILHQFRVRGPATVKLANRLGFLTRLEDKIGKITKGDLEGDTNLHYKEIQELYLSYDTATLTSNISNIDIEEIIDCFAIEIEQRLVKMPFRPPLNPQKKKDKANHTKIQMLLKESLIEPSQTISIEPNVREELASQMDEAESIGDSDSDAKTDYDPESDIFDKQVQSIAYDLSCFNYQYDDETDGACSRKDIKNFIQLVMMAGKMEKEAPIISYVYIKRILNVCKKDKISSANWKNLLLITLIEASKIWDDQSLENHSFSKVLKPYTTLQINRLERHLLGFLNYNLKIEARQYCESYFNLRKHASSASKTAHLMPLTLQTIKKLQTGTKKCERSLKQHYKKKLNESF